MSDHARFAPSAAHRWLNCSGSVNAAEKYPDPPGEAAHEGTAAHFLLETCLVDGTDPSSHLGKTIRVREGRVERVFEVTKDMARDVALGVETIREIVKTPGVSGVEARVDLSFLEPGQFGTTDLWHWGQDGVLTIADFKYGRLDVSPIENEQLMLYAAGVYIAAANNWLAGHEQMALLPSRICLVIIQPRSIAATPRVKTWSFPAIDLTVFQNRAYDAIVAANRAPTFDAGPWCRHCPALGECPATQVDKNLATALQTVDMTVGDAARILEKKDLIEKIVKRAEATMLDALLNGHKDERFPLVTQNKHRQWRDVDLAKERLIDAFGVNALEPPSPSGAEKLGKEGREIAKELSFSPTGDAVVGRLGDKRAAFLPKTATEMFGAALVATE